MERPKNQRRLQRSRLGYVHAWNVHGIVIENTHWCRDNHWRKNTHPGCAKGVWKRQCLCDSTSLDMGTWELLITLYPIILFLKLYYSPGWINVEYLIILAKVASLALAIRWLAPLQWRHNERGGVSNHQPHDFLLIRLFSRSSKKTSKLRVTGLCVGNSPVTGEFPAQRASNAENVSIWWRHHAMPKNSPWRMRLKSESTKCLHNLVIYVTCVRWIKRATKLMTTQKLYYYIYSFLATLK